MGCCKCASYKQFCSLSPSEFTHLCCQSLWCYAIIKDGKQSGSQRSCVLENWDPIIDSKKRGQVPILSKDCLLFFNRFFVRRLSMWVISYIFDSDSGLKVGLICPWNIKCSLFLLFYPLPLPSLASSSRELAWYWEWSSTEQDSE